jgi:phage terminase large subunit-like protein
MKRSDKIALERYREKLKLAASSSMVIASETAAEKKARIKRLQKDPAAFVAYYFPHYATCKSAHFHIAFAKAVQRHPTQKHFAQWGRALAKSVWSDVILPFWLWTLGELNYVVIIGNSKDKASRLLEDLQAELEANPRIIADYGEQRLEGSWEAGNFKTRGGLVGRALGMGQSVRGLRNQAQRPDMVVLDDIETKDLVKNPRRQDEMVRWIERDLIPTMDGPRRRMIYANNRFAPRMIQTELQARHPKWKVHEVNAYDPVTYEPSWQSKYDAQYFKDLEEEIGVLAAKAEYNNEPHVEGKIFTQEQIQWGARPRLNQFSIIVGHWDIAYAGTPTADFNAIKVWGLKGRQFWNLYNYVRRSKMAAAVHWMCDIQKSLPKTVSIIWRYESQFWNDEVQRTINEVQEATGVELALIKVDTPRSNKYERILTMQPTYQNGRPYYDEKLKANNDTQQGIAQLLGIEPGYKTPDDAPDADQQALSWLSLHISTSRNTPIRMGSFARQHRF